MRNYLLYILLIICSQFALCKDQSTNTKDIENYDISEVWESISKSKDHQVYISFLNDFPYSEYFDTALVRYFEFKQNFLDTIRLPDWDCFRDCIKVEVDSVGGILFENDTINLQTLRKAVLNQLINPNHDRYLPSKKTITDDTGVEREISKGFIYVIIRITYPKILKDVTIELKKATEDYKGYLSLIWYDKPINEISNVELNSLGSVFRTWYFFDKFDFYPIENILENIEEPNEIY